MNKSTNLIWIDLEMSGLCPDTNKIIEIATVVTDTNLHLLGTGPVFAIKQTEDVLSSMDAWNTKHHTESGLVARVRASTITEGDAERETVAFLEQYVKKGISPMCGNSICQDRRFLYRYMPTLAAFFHYRNLDVSTLKELAHRWRPDLTLYQTKRSKHLALSDIHDSIKELEYYRAHFLHLFEPQYAKT